MVQGISFGFTLTCEAGGAAVARVGEFGLSTGGRRS